MIYIASPYSSPDREVVRRRYWITCQFTFAAMKADLPAFSPILHCHHAAELLNLPTDSKFWGNYNRNMLESSKTLVVLGMPGWEESIGVEEEVKFAYNVQQMPCWILKVPTLSNDWFDTFVDCWQHFPSRFKTLKPSVVGKYKVGV